MEYATTRIAQYQSLINVRNTEIQIRWSSTGFFLAANSAAFAFVGSQLGNPGHLLPIGMIIASVFGVVISWVWGCISYIRHCAIEYWGKKIYELEQSLPNAHAIFRGREFAELRRTTDKTHCLIYLVVTLTFVIWLAALAVGIWFMCHPLGNPISIKIEW